MNTVLQDLFHLKRKPGSSELHILRRNANEENFGSWRTHINLFKEVLHLKYRLEHQGP